MPRQSHATKAVQLFTEILGDIETAVIRFAERSLPENLPAVLALAGAQLRGIATAVGEGLHTVFEQGLAKLASWFLFDDAQFDPIPSFDLYAVREPTDWPDWVAADWTVPAGGAHEAPVPESCGLMGVDPAGMVDQAHL